MPTNDSEITIHSNDAVESFAALAEWRPRRVVREKPLVYGANVASARLRSVRSAEWLPTLPAA